MGTCQMRIVPPVVGALDLEGGRAAFRPGVSCCPARGHRRGWNASIPTAVVDDLEPADSVAHADATVAEEAWAWRPMLVTASRMTARRCSLTVAGMAASTGPSNDAWTSKPTTGLRSRRSERTASRTPRPIAVCPKLEDGGADLSDRVVDIGDGRAQPIRCTGSHAGFAAMLWSREPDGEQTLDDRVVQIPGQAVPFVVDGHLLDPLVESGVLDGDACGEGQR